MVDTTECVEGKDRSTKLPYLVATASANVSCYLISFLMEDCVEILINLQLRY